VRNAEHICHHQRRLPTSVAALSVVVQVLYQQFNGMRLPCGLSRICLS
jgi:hypothetical protein